VTCADLDFGLMQSHGIAADCVRGHTFGCRTCCPSNVQKIKSSVRDVMEQQ